jgi:hypothetical protein
LALFSLLDAYQAPRTLLERIGKLIQVVCSYAQVLDGVIDFVVVRPDHPLHVGQQCLGLLQSGLQFSQIGSLTAGDKAHNLRQCVGRPPPERTGAPANRRLGQRNLEIGVLRDSDADLRLVWLIHRLRIRYVTETIAARFVAAVVVAPKLSHEEPVSAAAPTTVVTVAQALQRDLHGRLQFLGQFSPVDQVELRAQVGAHLPISDSRMAT